MSGSAIEIVRSIRDLRARVAAWRAAGETVGLVPTMGALHEGHLSLVDHAFRNATRVCATVFVNPKQFGPSEDYAVYPRTEERDAGLLRSVGANLLFAPSVEDVYPTGHCTQVAVAGIGDVLEGEFRPGFFTGVATVVTKLLLQALPDVAVFGEKDYQQLLVIRRLVRDLDVPVRVEGAPTIREQDGLAMSSRNAYLTTEERRIAPALHRSISGVVAEVRRGASPEEAAARGVEEVLAAGFRSVDYLTVRDADSLAPMRDNDRPARVLAAAWLGKARLIDNVAV